MRKKGKSRAQCRQSEDLRLRTVGVVQIRGSSPRLPGQSKISLILFFSYIMRLNFDPLPLRKKFDFSPNVIKEIKKSKLSSSK